MGGTHNICTGTSRMKQDKETDDKDKFKSEHGNQ